MAQTGNWKEALAGNLMRYRREKGLTQAELGEKLNYSDKSISKWERGEGTPDLTVLITLSELYGVSLDGLIGRGKGEDGDQAVSRGKIADRTFLMIVTQSIIWLIAILVFSALLLFGGEMAKKWLAFIYAIPVSLLFTGAYFVVWKLNAWAYGAFSATMWLSCVAVQLTVGAWFAPTIYIMGAALQLLSIIVIGIWILHKKSKKA